MACVLASSGVLKLLVWLNTACGEEVKYVLSSIKHWTV